ncbi:Cephalosporin-C deacetylase [Mariniphaga anaerophila]|uniref:Cephalosporin-C deacetylase n=1 Tax=Mariniphaga anaerophila TaxID=1484053 RepID=A0A1M4SJA6_9BACT|nr:acetylxylan esterase [Mariniphaga anaerophila]SHE32300.1 Cephalosporin-C deacetylase [Mariniphaga anaerophila]
MKRNLLFLFSFLVAINQPLFSQDASKSAFFANRGGDKLWLTYQNNYQALYRIISNEACSQLDEREQKISTLNSAEQWKKHQDEAKAVLCNSLKKFEKTPLNARTTGILERENFIVEKVLFESHPGFYVTAALFIPKERQNPAPAVIYACGHSDLGFRSETYQHIILNLVEKGFIVLAFDPMGQGERLQYPDTENGKSKVGGPTREHSFAGVQTLLTGSSLTDYFIWDGIRVLDYLETRPEVDMARIGINGRSGGGTQTAQISACDDRIYAAAPECYITNFRRLLQSIGPQDAEQNPYNGIVKGFDHPDYLHIRAPKPTLIITTTHDFFSIQGARETFKEVQKSYSALGKPDNIKMVEDLGVHESTKSNREALYAFFQKHLNLPGDPADIETTPFTPEELWVTPTGQVGNSYDCKSVFDLNQKYFSEEKLSMKKLPGKVKQVAGIDFDRNITAAVYTGRFDYKAFNVEKYFLENDKKDYALPLFVIKNADGNSKNVVVWVHPEGKEKLLEEPLLAELIKSGITVVSADLPGIGELSDPEFSGDGIIQGIPFNYTFGANLVGKSIPGIQAEAIDLLWQFTDTSFAEAEKTAVVQGTAASAFLHFAVLKKSFPKVAFLEFPKPAINLIKTELYNPAEAFAIAPGSLPFYDLPDLKSYLPKSGVKIALETPTIGVEKLIDFISE